ncbi:thioredoxin domain-containing protein [Desulfurivibrio dismutans]|uniref:thioredoxin domain-containing protein n=1 Tax=Desulfurivibrio dismutans TaxID=1398908 RepID=UPI0023DCCC5F|nr:thioredoxin domain-containing protein [Desulfurivibrio alkaliphilus]MDF1614861.1 thioredoxin domain-containing protein [Desulfurivibrio alkaliphilus]
MSNNTAAHFVEQQLAQGKKPNRLIDEQSPYLLQHAFNPVEWLPWGEEALARARREDKPVFLSIGYSTCHWCHVMAHESFADPAAAAVLNHHFIPVKVDREERPDVDHLYMTAALALNGGGGWPLSVFLTPEGQAFYAGTYFPPQPRHGLPGFKQLLELISNLWQERRDKVMEVAAGVIDHLSKNVSPPEKIEAGDQLAARAYTMTAGDFDATHGGFGAAPKFPRPVLSNFLLHHHWQSGEQAALQMVLFSLDRMAAGGIYDHLGGGFHRYSVDEQWRVPHFEKMLYDQSQLAALYLSAYQLGSNPRHAKVAADIFAYVLRDLQAPEGAFYSAEDADSLDPEEPANPEKHGEGLFYLWRETEIRQLLDPVSGELFCRHYGVRQEGNALADPHGEFQGKNILYQAADVAATAATCDLPVEAATDQLTAARQRLLATRTKRPRPHLDDKIITSWNGLMISALARGFQILERPEYRDTAVRAANFLLSKLRDSATGRLFRRYRNGRAGLPGQLADYAFLVQGLLDLYETTFAINWLAEAEKLTANQIALFHDPQNGGFFDAPEGDNTIPLRLKSDYDSAEPAGNSVAAMNLLRLAGFINKPEWRQLAVDTIGAFSPRLQEYPSALPQMLVAQSCAANPPRQIVIAGTPAEEGCRQMLAVIRRRYLPNTQVMLADDGAGQQWLAQRLPLLNDTGRLNDRPTAYLCQDFHCHRPVNEPEELAQLLD